MDYEERSLRKQQIGVSLIACAILLAGLGGTAIAPQSRASAQFFHAPIRIVGDSNFTAQNGVTSGTGTELDPYVIGGWEIGPANTSAIIISNCTSSHFEIRNARIHDIGAVTALSILQCSNGKVTGCRFEDLEAYGLWVMSSNNILVTNNVFVRNGVNHHGGALSLGSDVSDFWFYHNDVYDSTMTQVGDMQHTLNNVWLDDGYPSGGNYWSDYDGVDKKRGPNQDTNGSDGIGDTYFIGSRSWYVGDRYPLMESHNGHGGLGSMMALLALAVLGGVLLLAGVMLIKKRKGACASPRKRP